MVPSCATVIRLASIDIRQQRSGPQTPQTPQTRMRRADAGGSAMMSATGVPCRERSAADQSCGANWRGACQRIGGRPQPEASACRTDSHVRPGDLGAGHRLKHGSRPHLCWMHGNVLVPAAVSRDRRQAPASLLRRLPGVPRRAPMIRDNRKCIGDRCLRIRAPLPAPAPCAPPGARRHRCGQPRPAPQAV